MNFHDLVLEAMKRLAISEPIFGFEADFQLALAVQLNLSEPSVRVRREVCLINGKNLRADLVLRHGQRQHVIELKYVKQKLLWISPDGEKFDLRFGANDVYRHGILRDIARVEEFVTTTPSLTGSTIALTNAAALWNAPKPTNCDAYFDISEGAQMSGGVDWSPNTAEEVKATYGAIPSFRQTYEASWQPYSDLGVKNGKFRFLAIKIE